MARLPVDGGDPDAWGALMNEYLQIGHNADGSHRYSAELLGVPIALGEVTNDRRLLGSVGAGSSGELHLTYFTATKTEAITSLAMYSGATAAATVTLIRWGVYSVAANGDLTLIAATANDTTVFNAIQTRFVRPLTTTWAKTAGTRYAIGFLVVATTMPSVYGPSDIGTTLADTLWGREPRLAAKRIGQTDLPATILATALGDSRRGPFVECLL